ESRVSTPAGLRRTLVHRSQPEKVPEETRAAFQHSCGRHSAHSGCCSWFAKTRGQTDSAGSGESHRYGPRTRKSRRAAGRPYTKVFLWLSCSRNSYEPICPRPDIACHYVENLR